MTAAETKETRLQGSIEWGGKGEKKGCNSLGMAKGKRCCQKKRKDKTGQAVKTLGLMPNYETLI